MAPHSFTDALNTLRANFKTGVTRPYAFRIEQLKKLKAAIYKYEEELHAALYTDLKKSKEESWVTETGMVIAEISAMEKELKQWMQPQSVSTNLLNLPSSSKVYHEPLGVVLIIGPFNYPFQLLINPLLGAIAAGNCVVLKASEYAKATEAVIKKMMEEIFPSDYILMVEGNGAEVVPAMMNNFTFDHVFFTGSIPTGKAIYKMAAERLVPVTLELGGKSPCVVESDANIKVAARRIVVTKFSNAGQMCVAPDYILVHESKKQQLVEELKKAIQSFYGDAPESNYNFGKIISQKQFNRIETYLKDGNILHGGRTNKEQLFIEPTLMDNVSFDAPVMQDEIFGPVLPIHSFTTMEQVLQLIEQHPNPLSFYIYTSSSEKEKAWIDAVPFGGGCVNNSSWHLTNHHLPFGGRGFSGTGKYHGKYSFDTFSHQKAVMKTPTWFDPALKYPPFKGKLKLFKMVIR
ncbi:MAG: aldehyde dehydrogenase [Chitinophagaceae bacterium]|nr:aldehyde dehydrogenase [Chitinophagaceae bacterium]